MSSTDSIIVPTDIDNDPITWSGNPAHILGALHEVSDGATLKANLALVRSNARLAGQIASKLASA